MYCVTASAVVAHAQGLEPEIAVQTVEPTIVVVVPHGQFWRGRGCVVGGCSKKVCVRVCVCVCVLEWGGRVVLPCNYKTRAYCTCPEDMPSTYWLWHLMILF